MFAAFLAAMAVLTPNGLGDVRTGMTEADVERALGHDIRPTGPNGDACTTASFSGRNYLLFTGGRLRRVTVGTKRYETKAGLTVGDPQSAIRKAYGKRAQRSPHAYDPDGFYFDVDNGRRGLRFETDGDEITLIHGGRLPELGFVEACS